MLVKQSQKNNMCVADKASVLIRCRYRMHDSCAKNKDRYCVRSTSIRVSSTQIHDMLTIGFAHPQITIKLKLACVYNYYQALACL